MMNEDLLPPGAKQQSSNAEEDVKSQDNGCCHICCRFLESCQGTKLHGAIENANLQSKVGEDVCAKIMDIISYFPSIFLNRCYIFNTIIAVFTAIVFLIAISWASAYDAYRLSYIDIENSEQKAVIFIDCDPIATSCLSKSEVCTYFGFDCIPDWSEWSTWQQCYENRTQSQYRTACLDTNCSEISTEIQWRTCGCECENTCKYANDGLCQDFDIAGEQYCDYGTDCNDCGLRGDCLLCTSAAPSWKSGQLYVDLNGDFKQIHTGISNRVWEKTTTDSEKWDIYLYLVNTSWIMFHNMQLNSSQFYFAIEHAPNFIADYDVSNQWLIQMNENILNVSNLQILESDCNGIQLEASDVLVPVNSTVTISKIDNHSMTWIKFQFFMSWCAWVYLRSKMRERNMMSIIFVCSFFASNIISYIMRHLGFVLNNESECTVMFAPYFSDEYISAIPSFLVAFVAWMFFVACLLKRTVIKGGRTKLIVRGCGEIIDENNAKTDGCSVIINYLCFALFFYSAFISTFWLGLDNLMANAEKISDQHSNQFSEMVNVIELFFTTIIQYYVPGNQWYSVFAVAAYFANLLGLLDIAILTLKVIDSLSARRMCCKKR